MAKILVVGAGDVGGNLAVRLVQEGHDVWGLRRSEQQDETGIRWIQADVTESETLVGLPEHLDIVVYCVASPVFSREGYHEYYYRGLRHILKALRNHELRRVFFTSSSSVYHQSGGEWVDETSDTTPKSFAGQELLAAEQALIKNAIPGTVVRFTGIYGPGRNRMIEQARHGGHCDPEPSVWTNRIHRDDCVNVLMHLINKTLNDEALEAVYLATDDQPATLFDVLEWLKDRIGEADPDHDMPEVTRRANRRCANQRLKDSGYELIYSNYQEGYDALLTDMGYE